ncbi:MAG TPA: ABC transporter substrate-binding protein [Alphaproteobacteria bacterium]|nr:ABC transporter substrate-binding protein [Alphaproteobacteria bacterium]
MITENFNRRGIAACLVAAALLLAAPGAASASEAAEGFIQHCADDVAAIVSNRAATVHDKRSDIWQVIDRSTNSEQLARETLGDYAAPLPQKQIDRYVRAFRRYMRLRYAGELATALELEMTVTGSNEMRRSHNTRVMSRVSINGGHAREVDWRVVDDQFIADVQVNSVWLISDLKSQLEPVLVQSGGKLDAAIDYLNKRVKENE